MLVPQTIRTVRYRNTAPATTGRSIVKRPYDHYVITNAQLPLLPARAANSDSPSAIEVRDGMINWVGSPGEPDAPIDSYGRSGLAVFDIGGYCVLPGFHDNHVHTLISGDLASQPDLTGMDVNAIRAMLEHLKTAETDRRELFAHGWDYPYWAEPHKSVIDEIIDDRPVALFQFSGHAACVNSAMLRKLRIDRNTPDPDGGVIVRDGAGEPTGILRERASSPIHAEHMQALNRNPKLVEECLLKAQESFAKAGITSVGDNTWYPASARALVRMKQNNKLRVRTHCWSLGRSWHSLISMRFVPYDERWVRRGAEKYFLDGAFSTHTALLREPYDSDSENHGTAVLYGRKLRKTLKSLSRRKQQGAFHAIGDLAVHNFLNGVETLHGSEGTVLRHRLEHCQLVDPADFERFERLGVLAAVQPHAIASIEKDISILGTERAARCYPYRSLIDAGCSISFGSDSPAEPTFAPLDGIRRACLRDSHERISVREAITCYTEGSAYAEGSESWKGSIMPGMVADFVVLSRNPCDFDDTGDRSALEECEVVATLVGGAPTFGSIEL